MAEIFQFKPKAILTAAENLGAFIAKCRDQLTVFGSELNWDAPVWPNITVFAKLGVTTRKPKPQEMQDVTNGAIVIHTQRLKSDPGGNLLS
ncbi:hypothetical protein [Escherichia coli]|uniref:hypothetical protein n=1 Tax=Escherichia coli TaxID=562 RepID=UPI00358E01D8